MRGTSLCPRRMLYKMVLREAHEMAANIVSGNASVCVYLREHSKPVSAKLSWVIDILFRSTVSAAGLS